MSSKLKELSRNLEKVNQEYVKIQKILEKYLSDHKEDIVSIFGKTDFKVSIYKLNPYSKKTVIMQVNNGDSYNLVAKLNKSEDISDCSLDFKLVAIGKDREPVLLGKIKDIINEEKIKFEIEEAVYKFIKSII